MDPDADTLPVDLFGRTTDDLHDGRATAIGVQP